MVLTPSKKVSGLTRHCIGDSSELSATKKAARLRLRQGKHPVKGARHADEAFRNTRLVASVAEIAEVIVSRRDWIL
eukprot:706899-Amphidinium_carterae.1